MKYSYFFLSLAFVFCGTLEYTSAQNQGSDHFELPNELSIKYLNSTVEEIDAGCVRMGRCLAEKNRIIKDVCHRGGVRMIEQFASLMRDRPSASDADWDALVQNRCVTNIPLNMMVTLSMEIAWTCTLRDMHVPRDNIQRFHQEWIMEYCARVRRLALRQYQQNHH